jgi:dihydrofolate reductase
MAKIVFGMNQSLDGYVADVDGELGLPLHGPPGVAFFRYWIEYVRELRGSLYGRRMYEVMRYWDEDQPDWGADEHQFAAVWRAHPKWVASRTLKSAGPNATLVGDDLEGFVRRLKAEVEGTIAVAGPDLAGSLSDLGLIDEYQLYFRPVVLGSGKPYFARALPLLRLVDATPLGEAALRVTYVPG